MQRHIPLGYYILNGKANIQLESAEIVHEIFKDYLSGISTCKIAKNMTQRGILNANKKPSWNHCSIGKILENQKYLGDEFYPPLIEKDMFEQVQIRRQKIAKNLGRIPQPNSFVNQSIWNRLLVCGECGQPYRKYIKKGKQAKWKCKHYIYQKRVCCRNEFFDEKELEQSLIQAIDEVIKNPKYIKLDFRKEPTVESLKERKLTAQINSLLIESDCDIQRIKELAFQRAAEQYRNSKLDDRAYYNEKLINILYRIQVETKYDAMQIEQILSKIVVQKQKGLEFHLKNGRMITIQRMGET